MFAGLRNAIVKLAAPPRARGTTRGGEVGSGYAVTGGIPDIDYLDSLGFPEYLEEFKRVVNDAEVAKVLRETKQPIINADWSVEPASDDPRDVLIAEFIAVNRYQLDGDTFGVEFESEVPWEDRLLDALRFLDNGFSVFQELYRPQGRYTVLDKLKYLQPQSITRFEPGSKPDSFAGVIRNYTGTDGKAVTEEFVPMEQLVFYTWDQEGSNILGKSLLRSWWMAYTFKQKLARLMLIDKQKTAVGVPFFSHPEGDAPENIARGEKIVKMMRAGNVERLYVSGMIPGQDFGWKEAGIYSKGLPQEIELMNSEIRGGGGMGFTSLGQDQGQGGSRGVAGTQASFSTLLLEAIAKRIIRFERPGIRRQVDMNFYPPPTRYPRLKVAGIDPFEKTRILGEIREAVRDKVITNTLDTENELRRRWGLMEIDEAERTKVRSIEAPPPGTNPDTTPSQSPGKNPDNPNPEDAAAPDEKTAASPPTLARRRERLQQDGEDPVIRARVNAGAIRAELERLEGDYLSELRRLQADMREAVIVQIREGVLRPVDPKQVKVPFQEELKDRLIAVCKRARDYGREQVIKEVNLQLQALRQAARPDPSTRRGAIASSNQKAEVVAGLDVSNLVQRLQSQVTAQWNQLSGTDASAAEIAGKIDAYLGGLSEAQIESMARSSTSLSFNAGRNVAIVELAPQLQPYAIRVEVNDDNTCEPCAELDGQQFRIGSADYLENQAPMKCKGERRCRGFMVVQARV